MRQIHFVTSSKWYFRIIRCYVNPRELPFALNASILKWKFNLIYDFILNLSTIRNYHLRLLLMFHIDRWISYKLLFWLYELIHISIILFLIITRLNDLGSFFLLLQKIIRGRTELEQKKTTYICTHSMHVSKLLYTKIKKKHEKTQPFCSMKHTLPYYN